MAMRVDDHVGVWRYRPTARLPGPGAAGGQLADSGAARTTTAAAAKGGSWPTAATAAWGWWPAAAAAHSSLTACLSA